VSIKTSLLLNPNWKYEYWLERWGMSRRILAQSKKMRLSSLDQDWG